MQIVINSDFIYAITFGFGLFYALLITLRPKWFRIPDQYTFVAVGIGVFFTNVFIHILLALQGHAFTWVFLNVWWPYILTGGTMIAFQIMKLWFENREAADELERTRQEIIKRQETAKIEAEVETYD